MTRPAPLLRSVALPVVVTAGLLLLVLAGMLLITTRSLSRMTPLQEHLIVMQQMHDRILSMQRTALAGLDAATPVRRATLVDLRQTLAGLTLATDLLTDAGRDGLAQAQAQLDATDLPPREALLRGIALLHVVLVEENRAHARLLDTIQAQARLEQRLAAAALILIPLAAVLVLYLLRRRFLLPLDNINTLLARLGDGDYGPARMAAVDPVLEPLIANYNRMVARLARLEAEQQARQDGLEAEVRAATRELLAHNRSLAQADRLAAVGEMAAGLAHELRNPLAGIQFALANLGQELADADARARLDLVGAELRRITHLLNGLLDQARLVPEEATRVDLARVTGEVLALTRYQVAAGVVFEQAIPGDLYCWLPENRLRQALLNLALNAAQAMAGGGTVRVSARIDADRLTLSVSDQGPGFPELLLHGGVRPFASARPGGTGLGLASVRRLAQDLGGSLTLENVAPHGACITLLLPCKRHDPT
ncbi:MAG: ATP-binding protein [Gallionellaceae bacterium]|nr:ATP-binding protein [Gallionellaceae bacterium]